MCLNPQLIKNPNYLKLSDNKYMKFKDCSHQYIYVNCGHCSECIALKQMGLVQRIRMESIKNHLFFCTLSYKPAALPKFDVNGFSIPYADVHDVQNMFKLLRKYNAFGRPFRYFGVSELGGKRGRPHFHIVFLIPKYKDDDYYTCINLQKVMYSQVLKYWSRNVGTRKNPIYEPNLEYHEAYRNGQLHRNFDLHYVNPALSAEGEADVAFYVLKYMLKPSTREKRLQQALKLNLSSEEYDKVYKKIRSRYFKSIDFGLSRDEEVQNTIISNFRNLSKDFPYPVFVNPDGSTWPLSRFYKSKGYIYSFDDAELFYNKVEHPNGDSSYVQDIVSLNRYKDNLRKFNSKVRVAESHNIFEFLDF